MKKLRDIVINEIGDSSYKFTNKSYKPDQSDAYFNSKNGGAYNAFIRNMSHPKNHVADVYFTNDSMDSMDMTGTEGRHAHKVFSTVKNVIRQHLKANPQITHLNFTSKNDDGGRTKLYHAMAKHIDPDYQHSVSNGETQFNIKADKLR